MGGTSPETVRGWTSLEAARRGAPTDVLHLDMDAFFCSVELLTHPELVGKPLVVGGAGDRGVVASATYEARRYGVHSAMPMAVARRSCPGLVVLSPRHDEYARVSGELVALLEEVTPLVETVAFDEAYLDVSGAHALNGSSEQIAHLLRQRVRERLRLDCSVGVGRTKLVAKLASKAAKPRPGADGPLPGSGVVVVDPEHEAAFLDAHPLRAIPGIGPRSAERLARYGISTVAEVRRLGRERLVALLGASHGSGVFDLAFGVDARPVVADRAPRSIGHEETFARDDHELESLQSKAKEMAVSVAARCRRNGLAGRTVSIKVRFGDFTTVTRSKTLPRPATTAAEIGAVATALLEPLEVGRGVRLLGVQVSGLSELGETTSAQLELFDVRSGAAVSSAPHPRREELEAAADEIRRRFGSGALASLAASERNAREASGAHCPDPGGARE